MLAIELIPREMLFTVILYCLMNDMNDLEDIERECRVNNLLQIVCLGRNPTISTFRRFFKNSKPLVLKKLFLYTVVELNDLNYLDLVKLYVDSTDALVHGSKHYIITEFKVEAFEFLDEHNLIHDLTKNSKKRVLEELNNLEKEYDENNENLKYIRLVRRNLDFFNQDIFDKLPQLKRMMAEREIDKLSITFPESVMMPTKKGRQDFAFNVHEIMTDDKIVVTPFLSNLPNDKHCLEDIIIELKTNLKIILDLQKKYGSRKNYKEIENTLNKTILVLDSGYYEEDNLRVAYENDLNVIILPKRISTQINNQIRKDNNIEIKDKNKQNPKKLSRKTLTRTLKGYVCKNGKLLKLIRQWEVNKRDNSHKELPKNLRENRYEYHCSSCKNCPYAHKCDLETITDTMTPLEYEMIIKSLKKRYQKIYQQRFHCSEGINGYLKGKTGILYFMISDINACQNQLYLINIGYNLKRKINLKGVAY